MRVMAIVKADEATESGQMPSNEELAEMGRFNDHLIEAGVMLAGDGLHPSVKGVRVDYSGSEPAVVDGPFAETKELIAGYWIWQVGTFDEALEWARRAPFRDGTLELRPVFEMDDFEDMSAEERGRSEERRDRVAQQAD